MDKTLIIEKSNHLFMTKVKGLLLWQTKIIMFVKSTGTDLSCINNTTIFPITEYNSITFLSQYGFHP